MKQVRVRPRTLIHSMALTFTLVIALTVVGRQPAQAQTFTLLYSFTGLGDGAGPYAGLVRDSAGNLYGTTANGGSGGFDCPTGCGTVFQLDTAGNLMVLHSFGETGADGENPLYGSLLRDGAGNLYGTTGYGGAHGSGTVFKLSATGQEVVFSFPGGSKGGFPNGGLVLGSGNIYGTTQYRGSGCPPYGCGTVFKLNSTGKETVLYSFAGTPDGAYPYDGAGLLRDSAGNLIGTTPYGGAGGAGTVFNVDKLGNENVFYSFCSQPLCADGANPQDGLVRDNAGHLYGTTAHGGEGNAGTVFKVNAPLQESVLYSFCSQQDCVDGATPYAALVRDSAGNLYGTTLSGGANREGTVFKVDPTGQETVLYSFTGGADGYAPFSRLVRDSAGNLYGTAAFGGAYGSGTVFKIAP